MPPLTPPTGQTCLATPHFGHRTFPSTFGISAQAPATCHTRKPPHNCPNVRFHAFCHLNSLLSRYPQELHRGNCKTTRIRRTARWGHRALPCFAIASTVFPTKISNAAETHHPAIGVPRDLCPGPARFSSCLSDLSSPFAVESTNSNTRAPPAEPAPEYYCGKDLHNHDSSARKKPSRENNRHSSKDDS